MPFYDYSCARCGDFREIRPMSESGAARPCPDCGAPCERMLVTPFLAARDSGQPRNTPFRIPHVCGRGCWHSYAG